MRWSKWILVGQNLHSRPAPFYLLDEVDAALDASYRSALANLVAKTARHNTKPRGHKASFHMFPYFSYVQIVFCFRYVLMGFAQVSYSRLCSWEWMDCNIRGRSINWTFDFSRALATFKIQLNFVWKSLCGFVQELSTQTQWCTIVYPTR